ncbi:hypothetical protein IMZ48_14055 [Candidatus Bathyarchaeota archaeon]|nr:hypothetical protein [Candidatus Bathyarchaeota archaeon]
MTNTAVPISAIRLIHPITDPVTGVTRDVIIKRLASANVRRDRLTKTIEWDRYVPGLNTIIPWPEKTDPEEKQNEADTPRAAVQDATFVPTLLRAPMPEELVHELRNRYSRFRTRHEGWYVDRKTAEADAPRRAKREADTMITPQEEFNRQRKTERRALGQPVLSEDMLERLGALMVKNKPKSA